jgi:hypothetical protein
VPLSLDKERQKGDYEKMLSSNRLVVRLSRYLVPGVLGILLAGCPNPEGEFNDFVSRIPDAPVVVHVDAPPLIDGPLADVSGTFLIGLTNVLLTTGPVQFVATQTVDMTGGGYKVTLSFQPLDKTTRLAVGTPAVFGPVDVSSSGNFMATLPGELTIPAEADPLSLGAIVAHDVVITGRILTADRHCGTLDGTVTAPLPADLGDTMTTYGAIRVAPGTIGSALPPPEVKCP